MLLLLPTCSNPVMSYWGYDIVALSGYFNPYGYWHSHIHKHEHRRKLGAIIYHNMIASFSFTLKLWWLTVIHLADCIFDAPMYW